MTYSFIRTRLIISMIVGIIMMASTPAAAATFDPSTAALGARPLSLGGAFVGQADDTNSIFYNPAGLAALDKWTATSMYTKILDTVDYRMLGGTYKTQYGVFGIGYIGTSNPSGLRTGTATDEVYDQISFNTNTIIVSYGNKLSNLVKIASLPEDTSVGANIKILSQGFSGGSQDDKSGSGINLDLGATATLSPWAKAGVTLNNILPQSMTWSSGVNEDMPMKLTVGGAFDLMDKKLVGVLDATLGFAKEDGLTLHGGLEWQAMEYLKLRCGVDQVNASVDGAAGSVINLTAGVGFAYKGVTFDYAYFQDTSMTANQSHYFSISYSPEELGGLKAKDAKEVKKVKEASDKPVIIKDSSNSSDDAYIITNDDSKSDADPAESYYSNW